MRLAAGLLLAVCVMPAIAHQDETHRRMAGYDCEHPPADAVTELTGLLGRVGRLACLPTGSAILANDGWSWRYFATFVQMPMIPAFAHPDSMGKKPPFYFTRISAQQLSDEDVVRRSRELQDRVETYRPDGPLAAMTVVDATNNYGDSIKIFIPMQSQEDGWLIVCTPQCSLEYVIVIKKLRRN